MIIACPLAQINCVVINILQYSSREFCSLRDNFAADEVFDTLARAGADDGQELADKFLLQFILLFFVFLVEFGELSVYASVLTRTLCSTRKHICSYDDTFQRW